MRSVAWLLAFGLICGTSTIADAVPAELPRSSTARSPSRPAPEAHVPASPLGPVAPLGRPAWLGVTMKRVAQGVVVEHVVRGSPAEQSGLRVGDRLVAIDGAPITDPAEVTRHVSSLRGGASVRLSVARARGPEIIAVLLAPRPSGDELLRMDLVGAFAPPWSGTLPLAGAPSSLAELRGKVVLLDFWASFCGPCRMVAPRLSSLSDRFGAQGLRVVGLTTDPAGKAAVFADQVQMRYPIVIDPEGETTSAYGITGLPTMLLIDKRGVVREVYVGFDPGAEHTLVAKIKELLQEPSAIDAQPASSVRVPAQLPPRTPGAR